MRSRCKACDNKTKAYYQDRKKATRGPAPIEQLRKLLAYGERKIAEGETIDKDWARERVIGHRAANAGLRERLQKLIDEEE